ncbi:MAG: hypothetical protein K2X48_14025 [Chitinophagaceae bacterium]|nr:hypothetical protein [Chitinophagaceae bacterium]
MKKILLLLIIWLTPFFMQAQNADVIKWLKEYYSKIDPSSNIDSLTEAAVKNIYAVNIHDADLIFKNIQRLLSGSKGNYHFLRDLNIKPKTFQADSSAAALGFEYKYDNSWSKTKKTGNALFIQDYSLSLNGNVAFKRNLNPNNFLESGISYNGSFSWGGQPMEISEETSVLIETLEDSILERRKKKLPYMDLYQKANSFITVSDQFYIGGKLKLAFESNQDFSKTQFAPGLLIGIGAKGWNEHEALRYFNILDYPFALIRLLTGTDDHFNVYGATFPSFLVGLDYVIPQKDSVRKLLTGTTNPFQRVRFEVAFKTRVARIGKELLNFSSSYRWYNEINAAQNIKNNNLASSVFFVAAIESNTGFFVSYTTGKLPFDRRKDQVYALGFKYDLGNSKK